MENLPPPKFLSNQQSGVKSVESVKGRTLLEFETKNPDGSTYIARVFQPRTIPETESDMRFIFNIFIGGLKTIIWSVLVNLKIIKSKY